VGIGHGNYLFHGPFFFHELDNPGDYLVYSHSGGNGNDVLLKLVLGDG
jgi:hypothetical protein